MTSRPLQPVGKRGSNISWRTTYHRTGQICHELISLGKMVMHELQLGIQSDLVVAAQLHRFIALDHWNYRRRKIAAGHRLNSAHLLHGYKSFRFGP